MVNCKKQTKKPDGYHFRECGLDYVYLMNGYSIEEDPDFGESITVYNEDKLHREIARSVLLYKEKLSGQEIRFFRSLLRLTQEQLGDKLGVGRETVVRWENNNCKIQDSADGFLRIIVWEKYLDKDKSYEFFELHKRDRTHYKALEMVETKNNRWQTRLAA